MATSLYVQYTCTGPPRQIHRPPDHAHATHASLHPHVGALTGVPYHKTSWPQMARNGSNCRETGCGVLYVYKYQIWMNPNSHNSSFSCMLLAPPLRRWHSKQSKHCLPKQSVITDRTAHLAIITSYHYYRLRQYTQYTRRRKARASSILQLYRYGRSNLSGYPPI